MLHGEMGGQQAAGSRQVARWSAWGLLALPCLLSATRAWAGPDDLYQVTLTATHLHPRGFNFDRSQYYDLTLGSTTQRFDPPFPCRGGGDCSGQTSFINTLNCEFSPTGGAEMMSIVPIEAITALSETTGVCRYGTPSMSGRAVLFHRFFSGHDTPVLDHSFDVDLSQPATRLCPAVFPGDTAALVLELATVTLPAPVEVDSDSDGIGDDEEAHGVDLDCDGTPDVRWDLADPNLGGVHEVLADPQRPDIYVEVDWMDCAISRPGETGSSCQGILDPDGNPDLRSFEPDWTALASVTQAFADHGITLHIMAGEAIPAMGDQVGNKLEISDAAIDLPDPSIPDAQLVWDLYFGNLTDRDASAAARRAYKAAHVRYALFNHGNQGGGYAWEFGDMFRFSWHSGFTYEVGEFWSDVVTDFDRARELGHGFMHELGHSLGLHHGGHDPSPYKPNHFSVMTYRAPRLDDWGTPQTYDRAHNYNEVPDILDLCDLDETAPIVANSPIDWATTWTCPDLVTRGSGSIIGPNDYDCDGVLGEVHEGSLFAATCMELREPVVCVWPGADGTLETIPGGEDVRMGGEIVGGVDQQLQTVIATDASGNQLDELEFVADTTQLKIVPGDDGRLDSTPTGNDERRGGMIVAGGNLWCDTVAEATDEQGFGFHAPNCGPNGEVGGNQPCNNVVVVDEWAMLRFDLVGNVSGAYEGPPLTSPVEPTLADLEEVARRSSRADVGLSSSLTMGMGVHGHQATLIYDLVNFGPHRAVNPTIEVRLPEGTQLIHCHTAAGVCVQHGDRVVTQLAELRSGTSTSMELAVLAACDGTGAALDVSARVRTTSFDPNPSNDSVLDVLTVEPALDIGEPERPWIKSFSGGTPMPTVQTTEGPALALFCGYQAFDSPAFDTVDLGATATELSLDLFIPEAAWGGWVGSLDLFFEAPGLNIWNRWLAGHQLSSLARDQWVTVTLPLDSTVQAALLADTPGVRFRLASNLGACGTTVLLGNVRLDGEVTCRTASTPTESIVSSSVLRFETMADWTSSVGAATLEGGVVSEGAHALRVGPVPWTRLKSRPFQTGELSAVTSRLALDVFIPETPPGTHWVGGLGLLVDCPDAGLHDRWVGYHALQFLFEGEFNRLEYALPAEVVGALGTSGHACQLAFELSSNPTAGSFVLDAGGFLPESTP